MGRLCVLDYGRQHHLKRIRVLRLDAKMHMSLAAGRMLLYGLVVDEDTQREVASVRFPDNLDLEPSSCSLRMTRKRLYLSYHKVCASQTKGNCEWAQEEVAKMDCDRVYIHTLARWEAPLQVAAPPSVQSKVTKNSVASPGLDTAPTVPAVVQTLGRALPSASRLVWPTAQGASPRHVPAQQPRPSPTLPPSPPPQEPTMAAREIARDASSPHPPPQEQGTHVQASPPPELTQASEPIAAAPSATAVAGANLTATPLATTAPATTTQAMTTQATTTAATTTAAITTAATTTAATTTPTTTTPTAPAMLAIGKLTAERLHAWDDKSTQLPCDMVPSAHYVVDALGRRGVKSHNCVLSQWGHVSIEGQGKKVAWNAYAIVGGFGQKAPAVSAAKDLVDNIMAEVRQAGQVVSIPEGAPSDEVAYAVQDSFTQALPQAMTAGFEASSRQMKGNGQQGSMVTLALVCGHYLTVATAGTSPAHLDTGSDILMMSRLLTPEDGKPAPGIPVPTIRQVEIPECGARLLMGSKAFWHSIPLKQSVKNMRPKSAREVPTALQMVAIKKAVQQHPTIIVADLLPASSVTNKLDFQHLQEQQAEVQVWRPMEPATDKNPLPDWHAMMLHRRSANAPACEASTPQASQHPADAQTHSFPTEEMMPSVSTSTANAAATVSDSHDKSEAGAPNDGQGVQEKTSGGYSIITKAAKKRAGKRRGQARMAEAGEHVLKQQQQLATLARKQRRQPPSTPEHNALPHMPTTTVTNRHTDMSTDKPKSADTAIDSLADQAVDEDVCQVHAPQPQGPRRQGQGRVMPRRTSAPRAGMNNSATRRAKSRDTGSRAGTSGGNRGQDLCQSAGIVPARHHIQTSSNQVRPQALRQAQAAAARALSRPMPTDRTNDNGPTPGQDAPLEHDGMESGAADTTQHQGSLHILPGHDTVRLTTAAHRVGQRFQSNRRREHQNQQQQQHQPRQARTSQAYTPAVAGRQAGAAANQHSTVMTPPSSHRGVSTSTAAGARNRHSAVDGQMRFTTVDGYRNLREVRRPRRA